LISKRLREGFHLGEILPYYRCREQVSPNYNLKSMNSRIFKFSVPVRITIGSPCSRHFAHAGLLMIEQSSFGFLHPTSNARYSLVQFGSVAIQT
jgi:hypothetical protein